MALQKHQCFSLGNQEEGLVHTEDKQDCGYGAALFLLALSSHHRSPQSPYGTGLAQRGMGCSTQLQQREAQGAALPQPSRRHLPAPSRSMMEPSQWVVQLHLGPGWTQRCRWREAPCHSPVDEVANDRALHGRIGWLPGQDDIVPVGIVAFQVHGCPRSTCDQRVSIWGEGHSHSPWQVVLGSSATSACLSPTRSGWRASGEVSLLLCIFKLRAANPL